MKSAISYNKPDGLCRTPIKKDTFFILVISLHCDSNKDR